MFVLVHSTNIRKLKIVSKNREKIKFLTYDIICLIYFHIFAELLGVLGTKSRLRSYPMNLICIMTAQGNGTVFIVCRLGLGRVLWVV